MSPLVVDASVAVKWYLPEDMSDAALGLLGSGFMLHAPDLLRAELANAFWKRVLRDEIEQSVWDFARLRLERSIRRWHESGDYLVEAFAMACEMGHPVYDCVYLALARNLGAKLVTADRRLQARVDATAQTDLVVPLEEYSRHR